MTSNDFIWRFTPSRTEPELLERIFVQRQALLANIVDKVIEGTRTGNKHQLLLIGPRGIGKTHLISLLHHRITQQTDLADKLRIAWFLEDETITSFVQLLKRIYELLSEEHPDEFPAAWLSGQLEKPPAQIEKALEKELVRKFANRMLLLLIENLDLVFDGLGIDGQKKWRSFLQEHPFISIVAATQRLFSGVQNRAQPFFGFFTPIHLDPLRVGDAVNLLSRIAQQHTQEDLRQFLQTPEGRSRVRALHHLAGGNHRIYIVLSGFITRDSLDDLSQPFEKMADELTPYYQERMRWLSPQQRQIVEFLCSQDSPCTPKEMARQTFATESTISSQLKKLSEYGYVMKSIRGRESLYELTEPLMRLASEVKDKRRKPLRLLVDFLRIWYHPDHLSTLMESAINDSLRAYLLAAIEKSKSHPDPRLKAISEDIERAKQEGRLEDITDALEEQAHTSGLTCDWEALGHSQLNLKRYEAAIFSFDRVLQIQPNKVFAWFYKGQAFDECSQFDEAIKCYDRALEIDATLEFAWTFKGVSLEKLEHRDAARQCYDRALECNMQYAFAWGCKGHLARWHGQYAEAAACYDKALEIEPNNIHAWALKGVSLAQLGRISDALECYEIALRYDPQYSSVWISKAILYLQDGQFLQSLVCYDEVLKYDPHNLFCATQRSVILLRLLRWQDGFDALQSVLLEHHSHFDHDVDLIIQAVHAFSSTVAERRRHVAKLMQIYAESGKLAYLGDGLIRSHARIDGTQSSAKALHEWRDIWLAAAADYPEMELSLRIFRVGIEYLIKKDERVLLDLIATERRILRQALGLDSLSEESTTSSVE